MLRITRQDVTNIRTANGPLVAEALAHLDAAFDYLHTPNEEVGSLHADSTDTIAAGNGSDALSGDAHTPVSGDRVRTDFISDPFTHTETASRLGRMLQIFATLAAQAIWARHTEAAILEHGEQATAAHVLHRMASTLASRTIRQNAPGRDTDPMAKLYSQMVTDQLAGMCSMLTTIVDTAPYMADIYGAAATTLGCTVVELEDRIKTQDLAAGRAVAEECVKWTERKWVERGGTIDENTRATFRAMAGLGESGPLSGEGQMSLGDALATMGLDPADAKEVAPGVHVIGLAAGSARPFQPPHSGSAVEGDHIRVG